MTKLLFFVENSKQYDLDSSTIVLPLLQNLEFSSSRVSYFKSMEAFVILFNEIKSNNKYIDMR